MQFKSIKKYLPELQKHQNSLDNFLNEEIYTISGVDLDYRYNIIIRNYNNLLKIVLDDLCEELKDVNSKQTMYDIFLPKGDRELFFDNFNPYIFLKASSLTGSFNKKYHKIWKDRYEN